MVVLSSVLQVGDAYAFVFAYVLGERAAVAFVVVGFKAHQAGASSGGFFDDSSQTAVQRVQVFAVSREKARVIP